MGKSSQANQEREQAAYLKYQAEQEYLARKNKEEAENSIENKRRKQI